MVKVKENKPYEVDGTIQIEAWLDYMAQNSRYANSPLLRNSIALAQLSGADHATPSGGSCLQQGLHIAEILAEFELDVDAIAAGLLYPSVQYAELSLDDVQEQLGEKIKKLIQGVEKMDAIHSFQRQQRAPDHTQLDNIRKMLLAMVDDVRVVMIKLAERLCVLKGSIHMGRTLQQTLASEAMQIFSPLANRLGLGQIKWQMDDLAFRFMQPNEYKLIAKGLKSRRVERDEFVKDIVATLKKELLELGIKHFKITGRSKNIHSIYKKMQRKNITLDQITDATAVRVLVPTVEACYQVLSFVHTKWQQIPEEFDDYIANPKPNGYQSLHTAVEALHQKKFEVQIRTFEMHTLADHGVAAHWAYKEDAKLQKSAHERRIEWLREILEWQKEVASSQGMPTETITEDRVYLYTPEGDIKDLTVGATPLDFAYTIHSEVGHRCRGAKVNGKIVPLTHHLKTGDEVEILTSKIPSPSRDWLNPHLGYITTNKARAKIHHWFRLQEYDRHLEQGKELFERECQKLGISKPNLDDVAKQLNYKTGSDLLVAIGSNDISMVSVANKFHAPLPSREVEQIIPKLAPRKSAHQQDINIHGVGNLLTSMAKCCQPLPGEDIVGYITINRGITIHKQDCLHILNINQAKQARLIDVDWGNRQSKHFQAQIQVSAFHRATLINDITGILSHDKVSLLGMNTATDAAKNRMLISMSIEIESLSSLSKVLDKINQLSNVLDAKRVEL